MRALVEYFHRNGPIKSFEDACFDLHIRIDHIFKLAAHLIHWKRAKIIDTLNQHNIYQVSPTASFDAYDPHMVEFNVKFGSKNLILPQILALFSAPKPFSQLIHSAETALGLSGNKFLHIVIWMLQRNLLVQLHWYVHFLPPASNGPIEEDLEGRLELNERGGSRGMSSEMVVGADGELVREESVPSTSTINLPLDFDAERVSSIDPKKAVLAKVQRQDEANEARRNELGVEYMNQIADDSPVYKLFEKMWPYFRGRMHVEEIMWREKCFAGGSQHCPGNVSRCAR